MKKYSEKYRTTHFLNKFGLLQAFGSLFSITGNYFSFEYNNDILLDDTKALQDDWRTIGQDMQLASERHHLSNRHSPAANHKLNAR